jgi:hypothetical protein
MGLTVASERIDLLLLNASNYPGQPIYPYAFVQVSALARTRGLSVECFDFLGRRRSEWRHLVATLVATRKPRMVGFHIRQADSQYVHQYKSVAGAPPERTPYFPVDDTRTLIGYVRHVSDVPVVVGGFGFTAHFRRMCEFLRPNYAVRGEPDAFFDAFDALARSDISTANEIANLIVRDGDIYRSGPSAFFDPIGEPEYDERIFSDLLGFYARHGRLLSLGRQGEVDVPIEVMRGCPCKCYFCTEPFVKGQRTRRRDLDAVMADVEFLAARDVRCVWFICSEINISGMAFPLEIAQRMEKFNAGLGRSRMLWKAYAMPHPGMSHADLRYMMSAGYIPGWNEFAAFDDVNLKNCGMPYRTTQVVRYFKDVLELSRDPSVYHGPPLSKFEMFLGNAFTDARSLRTTLEIVDREGFSQMHEFGDVVVATRVYEANGVLNCGSEKSVFTIGPDGPKLQIDTLHPTFHYAPALLRALQSQEDVEKFLIYVAHTFLSKNYRLALNVPAFVISVISSENLATHIRHHAIQGLLCALHISYERELITMDDYDRQVMAAVDSVVETIWQNPSEASVRALFGPNTSDAAVRSLALQIVVKVLLKLNAEAFTPIYEYLGLEDETERATPYRIMKHLYSRFASNEHLVDSVLAAFALERQSLHHLHLEYFLFDNNVRIDPRYYSLLFNLADSP